MEHVAIKFEYLPNDLIIYILDKIIDYYNMSIHELVKNFKNKLIIEKILKIK
jgi:hypothetical protein